MGQILLARGVLLIALLQRNNFFSVPKNNLSQSYLISKTKKVLLDNFQVGKQEQLFPIRDCNVEQGLQLNIAPLRELKDLL